jgi:hypothetical protein
MKCPKGKFCLGKNIFLDSGTKYFETLILIIMMEMVVEDIMSLSSLLFIPLTLSLKTIKHLACKAMVVDYT